MSKRVYRGIIDDPKTDPSRREVPIPPRTAELLREWMESAVGPEPDAYVFAGEKGRPVWRDTLLYDHIRPKLKTHGLEWVDFQVMRATHASIGHRLKLDPKVTADQRGHGVGVAIEEYTKTSLQDRAVAARRLEEAVLGKPKVVRIAPRSLARFCCEFLNLQRLAKSASSILDRPNEARTRHVLPTKSPDLPSVAPGNRISRRLCCIDPQDTSRTTSENGRHKRTQANPMANDSKFKLGQSGNPQTTFKPGNRYRWQPGQSGNPAGIAGSRLRFEECFYASLIEQGAAEEAASLLWECARQREPWAVQVLLQRLAPETKQIRLTHGGDDEPTVDYTRLSDEELDHVERLLERATIPDGGTEDGEGQAQLESIRDAGVAGSGTGH
jgi:hypothetical protein